ncbi:hypothetical protein, partial [Staphylococcus pasteuri]|uniref:hypothetical protein n=1 Tax=Staphylococcus pasteuri TaxID=45972 RepID=UPI0034C645F0
MIILLSILLIISLFETFYLLIKIRNLKKRNASDREYEKMVNKYSPIGTITLIISIILLVIAFV